MACYKKVIPVLLAICFCLEIARGQSTISSSGGNGSGSGGTVSSTVGQVTCKTFSGTNGSVAQGVQQPYEISVVTAIENTETITLGLKIRPNPTAGIIILTVILSDNANYRYRLYDMNGALIGDKVIESDETEINMENLSPAIYFLEVLQDNMEVKVFRIIKN